MIQITNVYKRHEFLLALRIPLAFGEMARASGPVLIANPAIIILIVFIVQSTVWLVSPF